MRACRRWMPATPMSLKRTNRMAEKRERGGGFRGDGQIGGAGGDHGDAARVRRRQRRRAKWSGPAGRIRASGRAASTSAARSAGRRVPKARPLAAASARRLSMICAGGLALAIDDFRKALAVRGGRDRACCGFPQSWVSLVWITSFMLPERKPSRSSET